MTLWETENAPLPSAQWQIPTSAAGTAENRVLVLLGNTSFAAHLAMKNTTVHIFLIYISGLTSQDFYP